MALTFRSGSLLVVLALSAVFAAGCKSSEPAGPPPDPRACASDSDCAWRRSGCFEVCYSKTAPVEAKSYCAEACAPVDATCACRSGFCTDLGATGGAAASADGGSTAGMPRCGQD